MIITFQKHTPRVSDKAFVAESADLIGQVTIAEDASIWNQAVLRADLSPIYVGRGSNVQDLSCVHVTRENPTYIGNYVTIGHSAIVHACTIGDYTMVGMGATVLDGTKVGHHVIIGANSLVTQNKEIPDYSMVLGAPAKVVRTLTAQEIAMLEEHAINYIELAKAYLLEEENEGNEQK